VNKSRAIGFGILIVLLGGIIFAAWNWPSWQSRLVTGGDSTAPGKALQPLKIRIMDGLSVHSLHVLVAEKKGLFAEAGLEAEVSYCAIGKFCMDALNSGGVDFAGVVEMNIAQTLFTHDDIAILTEYSQPIRAVKFLGRADRGIKTIADLEGKKIGVFFGVNIHVFAVRALQAAGVPLDTVELINLKPPEAAAAFISGSIDAVVTWQPIVDSILQKVGEHTIMLTDDAERYWSWKLIIATRRSYLEKHAEEAKRLVRAIIEADSFIANHPEEAYAIFAQARDLEANKVALFASEIEYRVQITPRLIEMIDFETRWLPEYLPQFFGGKQPVTRDIRSLIAPILKDIKPDAWKLN